MDAGQTICELVREMETDYIRGNVTISKYVRFDMLETINTIEAYLNSKHISGEFDSLDREKPFFNVVNAAANIWYRATDIDRSDIHARPTATENVLVAFVMGVWIQNWMREENFGAFLNDWGRVLSRYGSAVPKFVEQGGRLIPSVTAWNRMIVDQIDFNANPQIQVLELTMSQLRSNPSYNQKMVDSLIDALKTRKTVDLQTKDIKPDYARLYEVHGNLSMELLTDNPDHSRVFTQQMQVVAFVESSSGKAGEYDEFVLYKGKERKCPWMITHLIPEDGRALAIGAVEHLFQTQWMTNHSVKLIKDQLDLASKLIFQTADPNFAGQNALSAIETGDILVNNGSPLTAINNTSHDITALQNFNTMWKTVGNEIVGISDAMLGNTAPSGTAWRQVDALLQENHSLFELMTENKELYIEQMFKEYVIPFIKKKMVNAKEIGAVLASHDIQKIDSIYVRNAAIKSVNKKITDQIIKGIQVSQGKQQGMIQDEMSSLQSGLAQLGNQRFFKPSEISDKTWKEIFADINEVEVTAGDEGNDVKASLATLNTALQVVMNPAYATNKKAQFLVNKIFEITGAVTPLELDSVPEPTPQPVAPNPTQTSVIPQAAT